MTEAQARKLSDEIIPDLNNIARAIEDDGDRSYFGSTNDADDLREIARWLDANLRTPAEPVGDAELRALLWQAHDTFERYAALHMQKGTPEGEEKARANAMLAEEIWTVLTPRTKTERAALQATPSNQRLLQAKGEALNALDRIYGVAINPRRTCEARIKEIERIARQALAGAPNGGDHG